MATSLFVGAILVVIMVHVAEMACRMLTHGHQQLPEGPALHALRRRRDCLCFHRLPSDHVVKALILIDVAEAINVNGKRYF